MSRTATVTVDIDGTADSFTLIVPDNARNLPERMGEIAGLLTWRMLDVADPPPGYAVAEVKGT